MTSDKSGNVSARPGPGSRPQGQAPRMRWRMLPYRRSGIGRHVGAMWSTGLPRACYFPYYVLRRTMYLGTSVGNSSRVRCREATRSTRNGDGRGVCCFVPLRVHDTTVQRTCSVPSTSGRESPICPVCQTPDHARTLLCRATLALGAATAALPSIGRLARDAGSTRAECTGAEGAKGAEMFFITRGMVQVTG